MKKNKINKQQIQRFPTRTDKGLTNYQANLREAQGYSNATEIKVSRTYLDIFIKNFITFFNILLLIIGVILIAAGKTVEVEDREPFYTLLAIEFGAGIYYNSGNENPKANDFGLGVGTYPGQIHAFEDGWYYLGDDNQWHYTHGVKAAMPMYNATMEIINQYKQIAREVFS